MTHSPEPAIPGQQSTAPQLRRGWLLDLYASPAESGGMTAWLIGEGPPSESPPGAGPPIQPSCGSGERFALEVPFSVAFYAAGPPAQLRELWHFLQRLPDPPGLERVERRTLFSSALLPLLEVRTPRPARLPALFNAAQQAFPALDYYDADLAASLRYAAACGAFPLAYMQAELDPAGQVRSLLPLDSPWELEPFPAPLRILEIEPDCDPAHAAPRSLRLHCGRASYRLLLDPPRPLLVNLRAILERHDPDLLLSAWGDTWLLPYLLELSAHLQLPVPLNRDPRLAPALHDARSYFSYGQVIYRGRQVYLAGRWHVDRCNAMMWDDYALEGALESARVSSLPLQSAARLSPGAGISALQVATALRQGILVPWRKAAAERPRRAMELIHSDMGGLVYQPLVGLHQQVAEIDFVSMYPGIMVRFNISPETAGPAPARPEELARFGGPDAPPGLVPQALAPLLAKRLALKRRLAHLPAWDPRRKPYKARAAAHKWLLVTCFGYLGYKNAPFGRIEAHEAVTAYGREALLRAKEAAEDLGFTVLHLYVDGLWVQRSGLANPADLDQLLEAITASTGLPIALEGIYRWIAFLPSRVDARVPVPNRYFGVFQDGTLKLRGIAARRGDTPHFIKQVQLELLEHLAQAPDLDAARRQLPAARRLLARRLAELRRGQVPLVGLLVSQKLSRELDLYRVPSPPARAARQLVDVGRQVRAGQRMRFLHTLGEPGVWAWDRPEPFDPRRLNLAYYAELLDRAAAEVLEPLSPDQPAGLLPGLPPPRGALVADRLPDFQSSAWLQPQG